MSDAHAPGPPPDAEVRRNLVSMIGEDWLATITGLALLLLVLAGVIGKGMVP